MYHYPHHIGDFNNATRHLTRVERSLYRDAIELYYDTEQALPADDFDRLAKRLLANSDEERIALHCVLSEFFTLVDGAWHHERCDAEISKYRAVAESKSKAGKASAAKRQRNSTDVQQDSTHVEQMRNMRATNQEPRTKNQSNPPISPDGGFDRFWKTYPKKIGKGAAERAWIKARVNGSVDALLAAVEAQKKSEQWLRDGGQFIPNPATWLNQKRWEDGLAVEVVPEQKKKYCVCCGKEATRIEMGVALCREHNRWDAEMRIGA